MYTKDDINKLLVILLPQHFDTIVLSIHNVLSQIDPSWQEGQYEFFSKHFKQQFWRLIFIKRYLVNDLSGGILHETEIFEKINNISQDMRDMDRAAYYWSVLSEYVLLCPIERFPQWADNQRKKTNWLMHWNLHSTALYPIYR